MEKTDYAILKEFRSTRKIYQELEEICIEKIDRVIQEQKLFIMEVMHRTKEVDSLMGKLQKKSGKYQTIKEVTDLCGFRIICYFSDTVDEIAKALEKVFTFDRENCIDKRKSLQATQFGYLSLHLICYLPKDRGYRDELCEIPFEIQIRTVLQHAWAEIEHDLGYKSSFGVPRPIRREFSRLAGLLEIADEQFVRIREMSKNYTRSIHDQIAEGEGTDILFDYVSLREFMRYNKEMLLFRKQIREELNVEIEDVDVSRFTNRINGFGVETVGDLSILFNRHRDFIYRKFKEISEKYELDIVSSDVILRELCRAEAIQRGL